MLWRAEEHERLADRAWNETVAREAISAIVGDAERAGAAGAAGAAEADGVWPSHPLDEPEEHERLSLYLGSAGVIWGLWALRSSLDAPAAISAALTRYRQEATGRSDLHAPSLLIGETGLLVVALMVGASGERHEREHRERLRELVRENRRHPSWELMWGSPGTMLAARCSGLSAEWEESARLLWDRWDEASDLWTQDLYGHVTQYLGPAHGFAANVHVLRGYVPDEVLRPCATRLLERTALRHDGLVNWPPSPGEPPSKLRVQWCHGAPGIVSTIGDLIPEPLAVGGGELTWRAGPLRKGPGLCHGTAGNGFAFLKLYELTRDECWLERARRFAMHAIGQVEQQRARFGRGRYSLWTGDIGVALYLNACLTADAAFPVISLSR